MGNRTIGASGSRPRESGLKLTRHTAPMQGSEVRLRRSSRSGIPARGMVLACGRDTEVSAVAKAPQVAAAMMHSGRKAAGMDAPCTVAAKAMTARTMTTKAMTAKAVAAVAAAEVPAP
jgi:hypothetical protein